MYIFDKEVWEPKKKTYTIGQWIIAIIMLVVLGGLALFGLATFIKMAIFIWGL
jgi:hypothetical protein